MPLLQPVLLPTGAAEALLEAKSTVSVAAAVDDGEEEGESYETALFAEEAGDEVVDEIDEPGEPGSARLTSEAVRQAVKQASQNVITLRTLNDYKRQYKSFIRFCVSNGFLKESQELDPKHLSEQTPEYIAIWIMDKCDDVDIYTSKKKPLKDPAATYSHAQKMRAAMTHHFARELGLGMTPWTESQVNPGLYLGNPSLSTTVSQYMISLRRKKTKAGEIVTSARAMEESVMKTLSAFNKNFPEAEFGQKARKDTDPAHWAGRNIRIMLSFLYIIAFLCLLRYDEALHIQWSDLKLTKVRDGVWCLEVCLPFRKTHQTGGIAPFFLYSDNERPWLCPIRAFAAWANTMKNLGMPLSGYVFRPRVGLDSISSDGKNAMRSGAFLECFRNNLLDINIDPRYYGTHSFRRGGCQWLAVVRRWSFRRICDWAGWSPNFDNPATLFKYLLSWTDNALERREDFFNPDRPQVDLCVHCGRTCPCA